MRIAEVLEYDNFPRFCLAIGLGFVYYYAYWGSRLFLLWPMVRLIPVRFFGNYGEERLLVVIVANVMESIVAAIPAGVAVAILIILLYRQNKRFFGSLAIVVYVLIAVGTVAVRLISRPTGNEAWVVALKLVRPLMVSVIFYSSLVFILKKRASTNRWLHRITDMPDSH